VAEIGILCACLCRSPSSPGARPSKTQKIEAEDTAGATKPSHFTTAGDEFNLCVRVLQKIVANDEAKSKELGYQRLTLSVPEWNELAAAVNDPRPLPDGLTGSTARHAWGEIITRCGGINGVLELVLRDREVRPSQDQRRGHRLCVRPLEQVGAGVREPMLLREMNLEVGLHDDGGLKIICGGDPASPLIQRVSLGAKSPIASLIQMHAASAQREIYAGASDKMSTNEYVANFRRAVEDGRGGHMLFVLCAELLGHSVDSLSLSTTKGAHRGDYAQVVLLFHELLPRTPNKMLLRTTYVYVPQVSVQ
jgi:hypothetical protein